MMNSLPTPMPVDLSDMDKIRSKEESSSEATTTTQEVVPKVGLKARLTSLY